MTRLVRFTFDPSLAPTTPDPSPAVLHGVLEESFVRAADGREWPRSAVRLLPPCSPTKIVCVGRNYVEHARELGNEVPAEPLIFFKPPSSLTGDGWPILYPALTSNLHYEGELGVVIGTRARRVPASEAHRHILGYTCVNDVTARDLQKKDGQWARAKGFDTFCPVGPYIAPAAEVDLAALRVRTLVDGVVRQDAPVTDMIFPVAKIIEFVTAFLTLEPGDLIATGTPPGVGPLQPNSEVVVDIMGLGALRNPVVADADGME